MKIIMLITLFYVPNLFGQDSSMKGGRNPFLQSNSFNLSVGTVYGMHANLRNAYPQGYYFVEGDGNASILSLPFQVRFRQSNEAYRFGQASYFRISFDANAYSKFNKIQLNDSLSKLKNDLSLKESEIHKAESKMSYLFLKLQEQKLKLNGKVPSISLPTSIPSLGTEFPGDSLKQTLPELDIDAPNLPQVPDFVPMHKSVDSIQLAMDELHANMEEMKLDYEKLQEKLGALEKLHLPALKHKFNFMNGFKKIDVGLTTLNQSSLSNNAIPIQGFQVRYEFGRYFVGAAAGYTLPSQLFSNQAFDQILYNSGNVFNMSDFFQVNQVRFVSSKQVGYFITPGNQLSVETFYAGNSRLTTEAGIKKLNNQSATTSVSSKIIPTWNKNILVTNSVGYAWLMPQDSLPNPTNPITERISISSSVEVQFPRIKSNFLAKYRRIPSNFDGWPQGIYLNQTERVEAVYTQTITSRMKVSVHGSRDNFFLTNALNSSRLINQIGIGNQWKITKSTLFSGNYSLLQMSERSTPIAPRNEISYLLRMGVVSNWQLGKNQLLSSQDFNYASIQALDSNQLLVQATSRFTYSLEHMNFGVLAQYNEFKGLSRIFGKQFLLQPEIGFTFKDFTLQFAFQQLWSDQFGKDYGMQGKTSVKLSDYVDCSLLVQRFLPTEYMFYIQQSITEIDPLYMQFAVHIHLRNHRSKTK